MATTTYPSGYGTDELTLDALMDKHCPVAVTEPEFRRRLRHWIESKHGLVGIGDILPRPRSSAISAASAAGRSFHMKQQFADGTSWASAVDLVVRRIGAGHSSGAVPWSEVPIQGSKYAADWGVHINVPGESWHMQCIEMDGFSTWDANGRKRPVAGFPLPCQPDPIPDPVLAFDPRNGKWGLWPINAQKPLLSTETFARERMTRADNRWQWTGDAVLYVQGVILHKAGGNVTVDGHYGPQTAGRVKDVQTRFGLTADGWVGPKTWPVIDALATA